MNTLVSQSLRTLACAGVSALLLAGLAVAAAAQTSPAAPKTDTDTASSSSANTGTNAFTSVFIVPTSPKQGRNPFFPNAAVRGPVQVASKTAAADTTAIVLNGITSPPRRTAMINGRTFEPGEDGEVKLSTGGKIEIRCLDIKDDSVVIMVAGQRREIRFRSSM